MSAAEELIDQFTGTTADERRAELNRRIDAIAATPNPLYASPDERAIREALDRDAPLVAFELRKKQKEQQEKA